MSDMDLNDFSLFVGGHEPSISDCSHFSDTIDSFFDECIIPNIHRWSFCIYAERKGTGIFRDQQIRKELLKMLLVISSTEFESKKDLIKEKSILIFDDSIKDGETITNILANVLSNSPANVTVAVIIASQEVLSGLRKNNPSIKFHAAIEASENDIIEKHNRIVGLYLENICLPIQEDHPVLIIRYSNGNRDDIFKAFKKYGDLVNDGCECLEYVNRAKYTLYLNNEYIKKILDPIKKMGLIDTQFKFEEIIMIRIYLLEGEICRLILQPIILRDFPQDGAGYFENTWKVVEMSILHSFLVKQILLNKLFYEKLIITNAAVCLNKNDWWNYL